MNRRLDSSAKTPENRAGLTENILEPGAGFEPAYSESAARQHLEHLTENMSSERVEVAVATANGKAYYNLVEELKRRRIRYLSLKPTDPIPLQVTAVLTTPHEAPSIKHERVITYSPNQDAGEAVEQALRVEPREKPQTLTAGVDIGKTSGLVILVDGYLRQTGNYTTPEGVVDAIEEAVRRLRPREVTVKLGRSGYRRRVNSAKDSYLDVTEEMRNTLLKRLGDDARVILVDENGTTARAKRLKIKRGERDMTSALDIALR